MTLTAKLLSILLALCLFAAATLVSARTVLPNGTFDTGTGGQGAAEHGGLANFPAPPIDPLNACPPGG
jgi:hypothetical protein